ncbi:MAG: CPBP family intramembrane metalloprotease [Polyangiaceae bacterium]|nr:CPBP family intramembrane metalloprotease [Polyangiaceae bacterium]
MQPRRAPHLRGPLDPHEGGGLLQSSARRVIVGYALLASLAAGLALAFRDDPPWSHPTPWWTLEPVEALVVSGATGTVLALLLVALTRVAVRRVQWARQLHVELRPLAHGLSLANIVWIAGLSSLGEELFFRGLLQPWLGLLPAAVLFGAAHQVPGPSRWVWVCWALAVGLLFGAVFAGTGSLLGPLIAHAVVNAVNLAYLRDHDPLAEPQQPAGG